MKPERSRGEIQENKTFPKTKPRRLQWIFSLVESRRLIHVRRAKQSPIQRVRPRVIRALNRCGVSILLFAKSRPAVTANVVKGADRRSLIFRDDQAFAGYFRKEIVAQVRRVGFDGPTNTQLVANIFCNSSAKISGETK